MAARLQNKITVDAAADSNSLDSLSFAGLICVQDQQSKCLPPTNKANQIHKQDTEFEFSHTESIVTDPIKHYPADLLISNGQIVPKATAFESTQRLKTDQLSINGPVRATRTRNKRSSETNGGTEVYAKPIPESRNQEKKEKPESRSSLGKKIFKSFFFPCKECQVAKPIKGAHRVSEQNGKSR
ncbi:hypothetical protein ACFX12_036782 [Malus domestica]